ncbi:hypothetical protein [Rhizobium sp. BK176]|uniref:hypothetical protein n=1 Tax=Rhizobium sp. BK176 TaxID=2587071 RepID=UPI00216A58D6|nr:hypothetical protein [Rhizobium sp. BK176]MCS4089706.1 hypothetical protein [Rhizobium sp. BK176]
MCKMTDEAYSKLAEQVGQPFSLGPDCSVQLTGGNPGLIGGMVSRLMSADVFASHGLTAVHGGVFSPTPLGYLVVAAAVFVPAFALGYLSGAKRRSEDVVGSSRIEPVL